MFIKVSISVAFFICRLHQNLRLRQGDITH
jgi:hypothetical protein